jgi:hypothetical protein
MALAATVAVAQQPSLIATAGAFRTARHVAQYDVAEEAV